ncbi:RNA polymerase sigma factor [Thalassoglobus neptunius]|uniref:RNA polymerase sigma factor n=1 Tax=Thalassoglobus neptunius TaxID=1938619 RepID=A0A5C5WJD4_9PLAN|nr:sigma-70 family RNA polymerase sigma factor [Thalassoglobus neptunius]TWT50093.1 RNA polymerase sigma factor [Thalassoglobus neptunius]
MNSQADREKWFQDAYKSLAGPARTYLKSRLGSHYESVAGEIIHDAFLVLFEKIESLPRKQVAPWFFGVLKKKQRKVLRRRRRISNAAIDIGTVEDERRDPRFRDLATSEVQAMCEEVHKLIQSLESPGREVILLRLDGMDYQDIAEVLNLSKENARQLYCRARHTIQNHFATSFECLS